MNRADKGPIAATFVTLLLSFVMTIPVHAQDWVYSTRPGDNLWNLAEKYLTSVGLFRRLQEHNQITDPLHILPGTRIRVPVAWLRVQPADVGVLEVRGQASVQRAADGSTAVLAKGDRLAAGDSLVTTSGGRVVLEFADRSRMLVRGDSAIVFDRLSAYGDTGMIDTRVRMTGGRVENEVTPAAGPASRFEIDTPAAVAAVRGTRFRVGADAQATRSEVLEGRVRVSGSGQGRDLDGGFGVIAAAGAPPPPPRPLLPAPALDSLPEVVETLVLSLEFTPLDGAATYRAEIFGEQGVVAVDDAVTSIPLIEFNAPPDGRYRLRVRGIESDGLEGRDALREVIINARPVPPPPVQPADLAATHGQPPELWWSTPQGAVNYRLQLADNEQFDDPLLDLVDLTVTRMRPALELPPGKYWWRVATRDGTGEVGPFGIARQFRMQAVPEPPAPGEAGVDGSALTISWGRVANVAHYEFEMARDAGFSELVVAEQLNEPSISLERPAAGTWHFRARGVSDEGVAGPWTPASSIDVPLENPWAYLLMLLPLLLLL